MMDKTPRQARRERDEDDPMGAFKRAREAEAWPLEHMLEDTPPHRVPLPDAPDYVKEHHAARAGDYSDAQFQRALDEKYEQDCADLPGGCHRQMFDSSTPPTEAEKRAWLERRYEEILATNPVPSLHGTPSQRKAAPVYSGVLRYFPLALAAVAHCSKVGNDQHNPGEPLYWAREKSTDEGDALARHLLEAGTRDADGVRHTTKVAWRALALLQKEIENDGGRL